jgi:hypothetical protein
MQTVKISCGKREHDCYSTRSYHANGRVSRILFTCPKCGPYREFLQLSDGTHGRWRLLQKHNGVPHSGVSFRWGDV